MCCETNWWTMNASQTGPTTILVATASVHTTAMACDYLETRLTADDTVLVLTVTEAAVDERDGGDAANVARVRLPDTIVETLTREGEPATAIHEVAQTRAVDEILIGNRRGDPERAGKPPGSTVRALLADPPAPVIVLGR